MATNSVEHQLLKHEAFPEILQGKWEHRYTNAVGEVYVDVVEITATTVIENDRTIAFDSASLWHGSDGVLQALQLKSDEDDWGRWNPVFLMPQPNGQLHIANSKGDSMYTKVT